MNTAAERHWPAEGTAELNQTICLGMSWLQNRSLEMCGVEGEVVFLFPQETKSYRFLLS